MGYTYPLENRCAVIRISM